MQPNLLPTSRLDRGAAPRRRRAATIGFAILASGALLVAAMPVASAHNNAHPYKPAFGTNVWGIKDMKARGVTPAYALIWATHKDAESGFEHVKKQLRMARDAGVTPVIQWYYWGDSISVNCIKYGCHGKAKWKWDKYAYSLAYHVKSVMGSRLAIVVLETEFNKNGVQYYEPMDGYLKKQSWIFRNKGIQTVLGFGNWGQNHWWRFDQAIASVTYLGVQEISSAYRDSTWTMGQSAEKVYKSGKYLHDKYGKRVLVTDFAISTWKGKEWVQTQEIKDIVWNKEKYSKAGIVGIIYRWVKDNPHQSWGHHGYAEKYWGMKRFDGSSKPGFNQWVWGTKGTPSAWRAYQG